ncbi:hypothetical protein DBB34_09140 [Sphaerisporangium cinnabarinum]|nr:hypothetical protein [Sphaerisporangium cinnabarinum]PTU56416.1 hypothetical protein DBB34_09140 [Sphaerisporangium cinnabarinum]
MDQPTPTLPERVRTGLYVAGTLLGLGAAPSLIALEQPALAAVAAAFSGACNALAFGFRPTRSS